MDPFELPETETPATLLRFLDKPEYAQDFIAGKLRFGLLDVYRKMEDKRGDKTEGESHVLWDFPEPISSIRVMGNKCYILCTSHPEADKIALKKRFKAPYIVRIRDPLALLQRINDAWRDHEYASGPGRLREVTYDKGEAMKPNHLLLTPVHYNYAQKPRDDYEIEREFRYVLICQAGMPEKQELYLQLQLPDCRDICCVDRRSSPVAIAE